MAIGPVISPGVKNPAAISPAGAILRPLCLVCVAVPFDPKEKVEFTAEVCEGPKGAGCIIFVCLVVEERVGAIVVADEDVVEVEDGGRALPARRGGRGRAGNKAFGSGGAPWLAKASNASQHQGYMSNTLR